MISYLFEIVGGPFDGVPGLSVRFPDVEAAAPDLIYVGRCEGKGRCVNDEAICRRAYHGNAHVTWWAPVEQSRPPSSFAYALERQWVESAGGDTSGRRFVDGRARYVDPRLRDLRPRASVGRVDQVNEDGTVTVKLPGKSRERELV